MEIENVTIKSLDGTNLEGELCVPSSPRYAVVLSHPHPKHQGSMRSIIPSTLFGSLPNHDAAVLRFNFRGIGNSEGAFSEGLGEADDLRAAVSYLHDITEGLPLIIAGWSFGADMAICVDAPPVSAWFLVAAPLREQNQPQFRIQNDERPKWFIIPERDQFRPPEEVAELTNTWTNSTIDVVSGADHFLVGKTDYVAQLCVAKLESLGE